MACDQSLGRLATADRCRYPVLVLFSAIPPRHIARKEEAMAGFRNFTTLLPQNFKRPFFAAALEHCRF
jgi:hypothetical protein